MLKALRENLKYLSWVLWLVIIAFIGSLFFDFGAMTGVSGTGSDAAAHVAGEPITFAELQDQHRQLDQQYRQMFGEQWSSELAEQLGIERQAIEMLVNRKVLLLEAQRLGLAVSDDELRREIRSISVFREDGRFVGGTRYAEILRNNRLTPDSFEASLREDLLLQKMQQVIAQNVFLSDAEVERTLREEAERATIAYLELPATEASDVTASQEELERYLAEHQDEFQLPAQRRVAYLLVDQNRLSQEVAPGDAELEAYYQRNPDEFRVDEQVEARHILLRTGGDRTVEEARQELEAARARIVAGEPFAALVRELSEEPGAAERGGDLGYFARGAMVPEFEAAAFGGEVGELIGPIESPFGVHLLEVTGRRPGGVRPFEEVRPQIVQQLRGEQAAERAGELADRLAGELRQGEPTLEALQAVADRHAAVQLQQPAPFSANGFVPGLGRVPEVSEAAFTLGEGELSDPIEVPRGFAVVLVQEALPPRVQELAEVEARVRREVEQEKRRQAVLERLELARGAIGPDRTLEDLAAELGVEVVESEEFGAGDPVGELGDAPAVATAAMQLAEGEIGGPLPTPQGAVIFRVTSRRHFDPAVAESRRDEVRERLIGERLNLLQAALIQHRREELGVRYSREVAESLQAGALGG